MHRGMEFDDQRYKPTCRRATVSDVAPTCEQMGLSVAARSDVTQERPPLFSHGAMHMGSGSLSAGKAG